MISVPGTNVRSVRLRGWHLIGMGAAVLVLCLASWLIGAVRDAREAARRSQCRGHFCQLKLAFHNYHDTYGTLPPAYVLGPDGTPWHSWRVLLLPFMDRRDIYDRYRFDEPWNGPNNRRLARLKPMPWLQCPSSPGYEVTPCTNYAVVVGDGTLFPGAQSTSLDDADPSTDAILLAEIEGLDIHWMEPRDLEFSAMAFEVNSLERQGISSPHRVGAQAMFARGGCGESMRFLENEEPAFQVKSWLLFPTNRHEEKPDD